MSYTPHSERQLTRNETILKDTIELDPYQSTRDLPQNVNMAIFNSTQTS